MTPLTEVELKALDLIIEAKKSGQLAAGFIDNIANDMNNLANNVGNAAEAVAKVTAAVAVVAAVAAGVPGTGGVAAGAAGQQGQGVSLDTLIKIREIALEEAKKNSP